jgi:hypothetical protein
MKKNRSKKNINKQQFSVLAVVGVSVLFFSVGFITSSVYASTQANRAKASAEQFMEHILAGKSDEAYSMTTGELQEIQSEEEFIAVTSILVSDDPVMPVDNKFFISGNEARYEQYVGGLEERASGAGKFNVELVKDGRRWKVQSLNVN